MPLLKSPGQILKVWKRATSDYLKLNSLKELPKGEKEWGVKFLPPLERLRKLAQQRCAGTKVKPTEFGNAREQCLTPIEKLRKIFKPRKSQAKVKKFYLVMCQITLTLEKLLCEELDDSESEPPTTALDDIDGDSVDQRGGDAEESEEATGVASEPAPQPAPTPAPPDPEALRYADRDRKVTVAVESATLPAGLLQQRAEIQKKIEATYNSGLTNPTRIGVKEGLERQLKDIDGKLKSTPASPQAADLNRLLDEARAFGGKKDYAQAHTRFDRIETLLKQPAPSAAPPAPQATPAPRAAPVPKADPIQEAIKKEAKRLKGDMKNIVPRVLEARAAGHPDAAELTELVREAYEKVSARALEETGQILAQVEKLLAKKVELKSAPESESAKEEAVRVWQLACGHATKVLKDLQEKVDETGHELAGETAAAIKAIVARIAKGLNTQKEAQGLASFLQSDSDINDLDAVKISGKSYSIRPGLLKALAAVQEQLPA